MATTIPSTATTTRLERLAHAVPWRTVIPLAVGAALSALAIPQTLGAWAALEAQATVDKIYNGKPASDAELAAASASLARALDWVSSSTWSGDLASLELERTQRLKWDDPARGRLLQDAERHLVDSLALNPADGYVWYRLAAVRMQRKAKPREILSTLMQSLDMAPSARGLWVPRAEGLLGRWDVLTDDERDAVQRQLRTIFLATPAISTDLFLAAIRAGKLPVLRQSLDDDPEAAALYDKLYKTYIPAEQK